MVNIPTLQGSACVYWKAGAINGPETFAANSGSAQLGYIRKHPFGSTEVEGTEHEHDRR